MKERIDQIIQEAQKFKISTKENLEDFRLKFLVKKGLVNKLFVDFKELGGEEKKIWGKELNIIKQNVELIFKEAEVKLNNVSDENVVENSLPGYFGELGSRHPISSVVAEMTQIFERLGFSVASGPEIEDDWHNFSALNLPKEHPAYKFAPKVEHFPRR